MIGGLAASFVPALGGNELVSGRIRNRSSGSSSCPWCHAEALAVTVWSVAGIGRLFRYGGLSAGFVPALGSHRLVGGRGSRESVGDRPVCRPRAVRGPDADCSATGRRRRAAQDAGGGVEREPGRESRRRVGRRGLASRLRAR